MKKAAAKPIRRFREFVSPPNAVAAVFITPTLCEFQQRDKEGFSSKQLTPTTLRLAFSQEPLDTYWLAPGVVRWGVTPAGTFAVGFYPPAKYKFSVQFKRGLRRLAVPMPALVFAGVGHSYYVWAMREKVINPKGQLFNAPLPNLNNLGLICFGPNAHPDVAQGGFGPSWKMFWEAPFSDHHMKGRSHMAMDDVREHLLKLSNAHANTFPPKALVPTGVTLEDAVERIINRGVN